MLKREPPGGPSPGIFCIRTCRADDHCESHRNPASDRVANGWPSRRRRLRGARERACAGADGTSHSPSRDRRARFPDGAAHRRSRRARTAERRDEVRSRGRHPRAARRNRESSRDARHQRAPDDIVVTPGSKPILFYSALALLENGDEALIPDPAYPIYDSVVRFAGARPITYRLDSCERLSSRRRCNRRIDHVAHAHPRSQHAAESHRWRHRCGPARRARAACRSERSDRGRRRDLSSVQLRRAAGSVDSHDPRHARAHASSSTDSPRPTR